MKPHPGIALQKKLTRIRMSGCELAGLIDVPPNRVYAILKGERIITADSALRLARYFNQSPLYWMKLQSDYDLHLAELASDISGTITPRS